MLIGQYFLNDLVNIPPRHADSLATSLQSRAATLSAKGEAL